MNDGLRLENFGCRTVREVNLQVPPGKFLGLTGPSGAGKTIFLRALADLDPYEGLMTLDGVPAGSLPAPQWRRQVALLPAESAWWADTVGAHFEKAPEEWFKRLGFDGQVMGWQVRHLSSGERQRLALLRVLVRRPRVLLLDEPTANLDAQNTAAAEALLADYGTEQRPCVLWVSHDLDQLRRRCDSILVLENNRLAPMDQAPALKVMRPGGKAHL